ncbi:hypothetical protein V8E36_000895 [Tilletia maclaganii]
MRTADASGHSTSASMTLRPDELAHEPSPVQVTRLSEVPPYEEFADQFLGPNRPCLLPLALVQDWPIFKCLHNARLEPSTDGSGSCDGSLHPAFSQLQEWYGDHRVPVVLPKISTDGDSEGEAARTEMLLSDAIALMRAHKSAKTGAVYIKDWHLVRQERLRTQHSPDTTRGPRTVYETPDIFKDDWMNNLRDDDADDFAFCYAGSAGSSTGIHRDVYTSYSWSTNIVGRKRWRLFPPCSVAGLRRFPEIRTSELAPNSDAADELMRQGELGPVSERKKGWQLWPSTRAQMCEIFQDPGETIFVPSDWHHEVLNVTDCISINHNWCNTYNLPSMFQSMIEEVEDVQLSLEDVRVMLSSAPASTVTQVENGADDWRREWVAIVQNVAREDAGWAWHGFWTMVEHNLEQPPTEARFRPTDTEVRRLVQGLLTRFQTRPEAPWLGGDVDACIQRIQALAGVPI